MKIYENDIDQTQLGDRRISEPSTDVYKCFWGIYGGGIEGL